MYGFEVYLGNEEFVYVFYSRRSQALSAYDHYQHLTENSVSYAKEIRNLISFANLRTYDLTNIPRTWKLIDENLLYS